MSHRTRLAPAAILLCAGLAVALQPKGAGAAKKPASLPSDLKLVPPDAMLFASVRVADLMANAEVKKAMQSADKEQQKALKEALRKLPVPPETIERFTVVVLLAGHKEVFPVPVFIVRTNKAYDGAKVLAALAPAKKNKALDDFVPVLRGVDERTFVFGIWSRDLARRLGVERLILPRGKGWTDEEWELKGRIGVRMLMDPSARMVAARAENHPLSAARITATRKHHVVVGMRPGALLRFVTAPTPPPVAEKKGGSELSELDLGPVSRREDEGGADTLGLLAFAPLAKAKSATLTLNVGTETTLAARMSFADAEAAKDGDTALRSALYVGREGLGMVLRELGLAKDKGPVVEMFRRAQASLRRAKVERDEATVRATVRLKVEPARLARAVVELEKAMALNRSTNNLKQIVLALHNYEAAYGRLPAQAITDAKGQPLLSWRVAILPFVEQQNLYLQFRFNEPWDSPHNKKLLAHMPSVYTAPGARTKQPHSTFYQGLAGPGAVFISAGPSMVPNAQPRPSFGRRLTDVTDGTSNTLMVVEAASAVPWTKPDDLVYDAKKPLPKLGGAFPEGFHAAFADGSVRLIGKDIDEKTLRALITVAGGEVIDRKKVPILRGPPAPTFRDVEKRRKR
jgi:hypothetical protein